MQCYKRAPLCTALILCFLHLHNGTTTSLVSNEQILTAGL